ncbi:MAG: hypothetical protein F6J99_35455 [Moorea sp. SIO4G3]|nr:hypothetical protein [Moorena sp. SIO4G3]
MAVGHAKGEREQTMSDCRGFPHSRFASRHRHLACYIFRAGRMPTQLLFIP